MTTITDMLLDPDFAVDLAIVRTLPPNVIKGWVQDAPVSNTLMIRASVQPMPTKELMLLPEGMRNQGVVKVFTEIELLTVDTALGSVPDRFEYQGATWQIQRSDNWSAVFTYWRSLAMRVTR